MSIVVSSLVYTYPSGVTALNGVTLSIEQGERLAIVGQNGAGKTTLVRHFNGIAKPTSGRVEVDGMDVAEHSIAALAHKVGYVFQNPDQQIFAKSVRAEVGFGPRNLGYDAGRAGTLVDWALGVMDLSGLADQHPYHLSLAERKRVALASVLAMDTPIVVLDEPTTGQDFVGVQGVSDVIGELNRGGKTVVAITHDMDFCVENFDRIVVMAQGDLIADGTPADVFREPFNLERGRIEAPQLMRLSEAVGLPEPAVTVDAFLTGIAARTG